MRLHRRNIAPSCIATHPNNKEMDPETVEKLRYRLNLQVQAKSPVRVITRSRKPLVSKIQGYQATYHQLILHEKQFLSTNRFAREDSRRAATRKGRTRKALNQTTLDPVQHSFLNALHQRVSHFLNPSLTPSLPPLPRRSRLPSESPSRRSDCSSISPPPYGSSIPYLSGVGYTRRSDSNKPALPSVFRNQTIREAELNRELLSHTVDVQTQQEEIDEGDRLRRCSSRKEMGEEERKNRSSGRLSIN